MIMSHIRLARTSLRMNRTRSLLTILGIIIGVASITLVLSLGQGMRESVTHQVGALGDNIMVVKPGQANYRDISTYNPYNTALTSTLTERDLQSVSTVPNVAAVAPLMFLSGTVKSTQTAVSTSPIIATSGDLQSILNLHLQSGEFISPNTNRDTAVLGQSLAVQLFGTDQAMGQTLTIKGREHIVIGVVKDTNAPINLSGVDLDHAAYVSLEDGKSFNQGLAQIQQLNIKMANPTIVSVTSDNVSQQLLTNHEGENDFAVLAGNDIAKSADGFFSNIIIVTSIVSLVTVIVGGIGIMNIMLVAVSERTREIGIRKSLGATDGSILGQFMIEALAMCIIGGVIGLLIAYAGAFIIGTILSFSPAINWQILAAGFGLSLLLGVIFGMYPALKASHKDPIEALREYQ